MASKSNFQKAQRDARKNVKPGQGGERKSNKYAEFSKADEVAKEHDERTREQTSVHTERG